MSEQTLIDRLRKPLEGYPHGCEQSNLWHEAADRIAELEAANELLITENAAWAEKFVSL